MADREREHAEGAGVSETRRQPSWYSQAERLLGTQVDGVIISTKPSVAEVVTGYILTRLGIISPDNKVYSSNDPSFGKKSTSWFSSSVHLNNIDVQNPSLLTVLIDKDKRRDLSEREKQQLKGLALFCENYRKKIPSKWYLAGGKPVNFKRGNEFQLHKFLCELLVENSYPPESAYQQAVEKLGEVCRKSSDLRKLDLSTLSTLGVIETIPRELILFLREFGANPVLREFVSPVLKSHNDEPDVIDYKKFVFNRRRAMFLQDVRAVVYIGGSPHSGKSTLSACLFHAMNNLLLECEKDGVIDPGVIKIEHCDLDFSTPTSSFIVRGEPVVREKKTWSEDLVNKATGQLYSCMFNNNIVIADLPGRTTEFTHSLLTYPKIHSSSSFSILVDRERGSEVKKWVKFLETMVPASFMVRLHTRYQEGGRVSAMRIQNPKKPPFLTGRVVDLDRDKGIKPKLNDSFIQLMAHFFLFDWLPQIKADRFEYKRELYTALGINIGNEE